MEVSKSKKKQVGEGVVQHVELKKKKSVETQAVENLERPIETEQEDKSQIKLEEIKKRESQKSTKENPLALKSLIIKNGDTLSKLAFKLYGTFDNNIINLIRKYNPEIKDLNRIRVGKNLVLPLTSLPDEGTVYTVHIASFRSFKYAKDRFLKMVKEGYEGYIISTDNSLKGKVFRVTLGTFRNHKEAKDSASMIIEKNISDYAEAIKLEVN